MKKYISYQIFTRLFGEGKEYDDADRYIAERGWQDWMTPFSVDDIAKILNAILELSHMTLEGVREKMGLSRAEFSRRYYIPTRTLDDWEHSRRQAPVYVTTLIFYTIFLDSYYGGKDKAE